MTHELEALGAIILRTSHNENEIGTFQRTEHRTYHPNIYEATIGGEFKIDDTPEIVLKREFSEKIKRDPINIVYLGPILIDEENTQIKRHLFLCTFPENEDPEIDLKKHKGFTWRKIRDLKDFSDFIPGTKAMLQKAGLI